MAVRATQLGAAPPSPSQPPMASSAEFVSTRGMRNQVRIRGPKPDVQFQCGSLAMLEELLYRHTELCKAQAVTETVYAQFIFDSDVVFQIVDLSDGIRDHFPALANHPDDDSPGPVPVVDAVSQNSDGKSKLKRQRAVGRAILRSIQSVDGFHYFEKEAWDTKHADGYRFKYLCRDSYQNKDRAANKLRKSEGGTPTQALKDASTKYGAEHDAANAMTADGNPARLPTYDCKGSIFVKFSSSKQIVDVIYQHLPIHNSTNLRTDEPTPTPAAPNNHASYEDSGDAIDHTEIGANETTGASTPQPAPVLQSTKTRKRKRPYKTSRRSILPEDNSDIDDLEDDFESRPPPLPLLDPGWEPDPGDGDLWRPSVVTRVPGLKIQMKQAVRQSFKSSAAALPNRRDDSSASGSDFGVEEKKPKRKYTKHKNKVAAANGTPGVAPVSVAKAAPPSSVQSSAQHEGTESDRPSKRRTKTGCWTCRSRKLKCDEIRPSCSQCARSRPPRDCSFPEDEEVIP